MTAKQKAEANVAPAAEAAPPDPSGWSEVRLRRPFYSVAKCERAPLRGYLLSSERIHTVHGDREQLVFRLTADTLGFRGRDAEEAETIKAGEEITVMASADLARLASKLRDDLVVEYFIVPTERDKAIKGNPWRFNVRANPKPRRREVMDGIPRVSLTADRPEGEGAGDDIPF